MFKRFNKKENINGQNQVKSSVCRGIRAKLIEQFPRIEKVIDEILPKKIPLYIAKCENQFKSDPDICPRLRADKGAIKFVFSGANIMCPGLTSKGATIEDETGADQVVAIYAEGKENALAVGITKMSTADMRSINKGIAVDNIHYLNDGLWSTPTI